MKEVIQYNFDQLYPEILISLKDAKFIAIDNEFTGLLSSDGLKNSLFDSPDDRYYKIKQNIEPFIILQVGITTFKHIENNQFLAETFCFSLVPRSLPMKNRTFQCQIEALEFLTQNNFDFNKALSDGITYANKPDQDKLKKLIKSGSLYTIIKDNASFYDIDNVKIACSNVQDFLRSSKSDLDKLNIPTSSVVMQYLLEKELRIRFKDVWTISGDNFVTVIKVKADVRESLEKEENLLDDKLFEYYLGFSRVFECLTMLKKPIIGHNLFVDLIYMYQQFYKPLPNTYREFKKTINQLFPTIYDTKHLSYELREVLTKTEKWNINSLGGLYEYFQNGPGKYLVFNTPSVKLLNPSDSGLQICHNAGWDSYLAGSVFVCMAHLFAIRKFGSGYQQKILTTKELLSGVKIFENCVNLMRASVNYLKLDGPDPEVKRPEWLHIKFLVPNSTIYQAAEKLSAFGTVDLRYLAKHRALLAVSNHRSARDILKHFKNSKELYIEPYRVYRHSPFVKNIAI
ncbi:pre-piRNA 3'-exonuclease trimmer-like isoform X2 [Prorops nasuta]